MPYKFWKKLGITKGIQFDIQLRGAIKRNLSFNAFQREMMHRGLSFRRKDMLEDWRRAQAIERAKTASGRWDAIHFWDDFVMKEAEREGISTAKFMEEWHKTREKIQRMEELSVSEEEIWEAYRTLWH
ncbi:MAG: hypothetical protein QIT46_gp02 [Methanophagales virus PBV305]|uniref:Uncharacterized protein n=1 Tax=Methanophagales virus PBV305 TaxID=3071310 RepID=A0AA46TEG3_9VIRU|nr:MAG: hypothetical protein QIT46_gp02 [Methanophagales virus PBV305]UYL65054.1 MAG: hypothetical protein HJKPNNFO_00002 [Methanophagales virus PBV305]